MKQLEGVLTLKDAVRRGLLVTLSTRLVGLCVEGAWLAGLALVMEGGEGQSLVAFAVRVHAGGQRDRAAQSTLHGPRRHHSTAARRVKCKCKR